MDWFLYSKDFRHERFNSELIHLNWSSRRGIGGTPANIKDGELYNNS